jgi:phosphatidylglycerophosphatase A
MKQTVEKRKPQGIVDHIALALTTFGVGYIPGAPGTYGSAVAVVLYLTITAFATPFYVFFSFHGEVSPPPYFYAWIHAAVTVSLMLFCLIGVWASTRSIPLLGNEDPSEAVVDEVMGQLVTFCFVPFGVSWPFVLAGFILFRVFDIWKPYPIKAFEDLRGGLGICADDIVAGVYAGICLAIGYAIYLWI